MWEPTNPQDYQRELPSGAVVRVRRHASIIATGMQPRQFKWIAEFYRDSYERDYGSSTFTASHSRGAALAVRELRRVMIRKVNEI